MTSHPVWWLHNLFWFWLYTKGEHFCKLKRQKIRVVRLHEKIVCVKFCEHWTELVDHENCLPIWHKIQKCIHWHHGVHWTWLWSKESSDPNWNMTYVLKVKSVNTPPNLTCWWESWYKQTWDCPISVPNFNTFYLTVLRAAIDTLARRRRKRRQWRRKERNTMGVSLLLAPQLWCY